MQQLMNPGVSLSGVGMPIPAPVINGSVMDTLERFSSPLDAGFALTNAGGAAMSFAKGNVLSGLYQSFQAGAGVLSDMGPGVINSVMDGAKSLLKGEGNLMDVISPVKLDLSNKLDLAMNPPAPAMDLPTPGMTPGRA